MVYRKMLVLKIYLAAFSFCVVTHLTAQTSSRPARAQKLRIATYQYADNPRIKNLEPLAAHLQEKSGIETEVKSFPTVKLFIEAIHRGDIDLAFINTFGYLLLETSNKSYPMMPVAAMVVPDSVKSNYSTAFVASVASPIKAWPDVKKYAAKSRLALVFSTSTSGNLVPRLGLTSLGIENAERSFKSVSYARTHANAINYLLNDSADIAAMGSTEYHKLPAQQKDKLRLIWESPEIPLGPALVSTRLDKATYKMIVDELLDLHHSNTIAFNSLKMAWSESQMASRFVLISRNYYDPFLEHFGSKKHIYEVLEEFAR